MDQTERQGTWTTVAKAASALLAGLVVLVLLFPASGIEPIPPVCFSVFGYTVPCGEGLAFAAGSSDGWGRRLVVLDLCPPKAQEVSRRLAVRLRLANDETDEQSHQTSRTSQASTPRLEQGRLPECARP